MTNCKLTFASICQFQCFNCSVEYRTTSYRLHLRSARSARDFHVDFATHNGKNVPDSITERLTDLARRHCTFSHIDDALVLGPRGRLLRTVAAHTRNVRPCETLRHENTTTRSPNAVKIDAAFRNGESHARSGHANILYASRRIIERR